VLALVLTFGAIVGASLLAKSLALVARADGVAGKPAPTQIIHSRRDAFWLPRVCVVWVRSGLAGQLQVFASATGGLVRPQDSARSTISRPSLVCSQGSGRPRTGPGRLGWGCGAGWPV